MNLRRKAEKNIKKLLTTKTTLILSPYTEAPKSKNEYKMEPSHPFRDSNIQITRNV